MSLRQIFRIMLLSVALGFGNSLQDFPELTNMMYDICGVAAFDLTPEWPCQHQLFVLAMAWRECGDAHGPDLESFRSCLDGCIPDGLCTGMCGAQNDATLHCHNECSQLKACVQTALAQTRGQVSAEGQVRRCFAGDKKVVLLAGPSDGGGVSEVASRLPSAGDMLAALWAMAAPAQAGAAPPAAPGKASAPAGVAPTAKGIAGSAKAAVITDPCDCDLSGKVGGASGCGAHGQEPHAGAERYCYISGGMECPGAMPSGRFQGAHWVGCAEPGDHYAQLLPAKCELRSPQGAAAALDAPLAVPEAPTGHGAPPLSPARPPLPAPRFLAEAEAIIAKRTAPVTPLPQEWHAKHGGLFLSPEATPQPGPPVPATLDTPQWWVQAKGKAAAILSQSAPFLARAAAHLPTLTANGGVAP